MIEIGIESDSEIFAAALGNLSQAEARAELTISEIAAPAKLAAHAVAFAADVSDEHLSEHSDAGTGRFVLLHDENPQEQWGSNFRVVAFAKSPLETLIGSDEMISDVAWAWLMEALRNRGAKYSHEAGTITRIISTGYGTLSNQGEHAELEMRISWTPEGDVSRHLEAWQDLLCMMSGYPLLPPKVSPLRMRQQ